MIYFVKKVVLKMCNLLLFFGSRERGEDPRRSGSEEKVTGQVPSRTRCLLTLYSLLSAGPPGRRGKPGRRGEPGKHRLSPATSLGTPRVSLGWMWEPFNSRCRSSSSNGLQNGGLPTSLCAGYKGFYENQKNKPKP